MHLLLSSPSLVDTVVLQRGLNIFPVNISIFMGIRSSSILNIREIVLHSFSTKSNLLHITFYFHVELLYFKSGNSQSVCLKVVSISIYIFSERTGYMLVCIIYILVSPFTGNFLKKVKQLTLFLGRFFLVQYSSMVKIWRKIVIFLFRTGGDGPHYNHHWASQVFL